MKDLEEAIIKVYLLHRDRLREQAREMLPLAPDQKIPPIWVVPLDVPAVDRLVSRSKPYLYYDRRTDRFTHIVHTFTIPVGGTTGTAGPVFPVHRVITVPEAQG